ncbi:MAG: hypothetical protein HZB26_00585 [Candidatus Hydrogenedentes bacterium]|nr:hypothetical protein [Candidatus Hydrogenedentota bacterium]
MKTTEEITKQTVYTSEVLPSVRTTNERLARVIAWADAHPYAWQIVCGRRSKPFGKNSCVYIGWAQRADTSAAVLERARHLHELVHNEYPYAGEDSIFVFRARFTAEHFGDKEFEGGFFQQHDAKYPRSCLDLDYTPETFELVLQKFIEWMDKSYQTARITVNGETVWTVSEGRAIACPAAPQ